MGSLAFLQGSGRVDLTLDWPSFHPSTRPLIARVRVGEPPLPDRAMRILGAVLAGIILSVTARYTQPVGPDTTTPAWTGVAAEIRAQGMGNCYLTAFTLAANAQALGLENVTVVQGTQMGSGDLAGVRFGHSWLEANVIGQTERVAIDYSSGNTLVMDRDAYRLMGQAQDIHEYSVNEAMSLAADGNYGPWTQDVLNAYHP